MFTDCVHPTLDRDVRCVDRGPISHYTVHHIAEITRHSPRTATGEHHASHGIYVSGCAAFSFRGEVLT